jgi:polyferredoxin
MSRDFPEGAGGGMSDPYSVRAEAQTERRRRVGLLLFVAGLMLFVFAFGMFVLFVRYFGEGEGRWGDVILAGAWLTLIAAVAAGIAALFAFFAAERSA